MVKSVLFIGIFLGLCTLPGIGQIEIQKQAMCNTVWEYADWGRDIGKYNNLLPFDFHADGTIELIANVRNYSLIGGNSYSWLILQYDPQKLSYDQVYISQRYANDINRMVLQDLDGDGRAELLLNENNNLHVIDMESLQTLRTVTLQGVYSPFYRAQIRYGDIDNDGEQEIVVGGHSKLNIINALTFEVERIISVDASEFDIGNVDQDTLTEIAFHTGEVWQITGSNILNEYIFRNPQGSTQNDRLELEDIDNDQREEAVMYVSSDSLHVYDLETQTRKYGKYIDTWIGAFYITDLEEDGSKEIIYGGNQWDDIYCVRAASGVQRWRITNEGYGTMGITVADSDHDGVKELTWTSIDDMNSLIQVYDVMTRTKEWSNPGSGSPFYGIAIADIDADAHPEVVLAGNIYGDLKIFDAHTKKMEYQSPLDLLPKSSRGVYNLLIDDYKADGDLDILIGTDLGNNGAIYIIDGDTHTIESSHVFTSGDPSSIFDLGYADVNGDGIKEFIALTGNHVFVINSTTYQVLWSSENFGIPVDRYNDLIIGNADLDTAKEIVVCKDRIRIYDDVTFASKASEKDQYLSALLLDVDHDGRAEIMASGQDGIIDVMETENMTLLQEFHFGEEAITGLDTIDLNKDGVDEFMATTDSRILFFNSAGLYLYSQLITPDLGDHDAMVVKDIDADGTPEVFVGTERGIIQLNINCASCLFFDPYVTYLDPRCGELNGEIQIQSSDTSARYFSNGQPFLSPYTGLDAGHYHLLMENQDGCHFEGDVNLERHDLDIDAYGGLRSCLGVDDGKAFLSVDKAVSPYQVTWSNGGTTDTIKNLPVGLYHVTLTDFLGCVFMDSVYVQQDTVRSTVVISKPSCRGVDDGVAKFNIQQGVPPFQFEWDGQPGQFINDSLNTGMHTAFMVDALGCNNSHLIEIPETYDEVAASLLLPSCNGLPTGSLLANVTAGNPPYVYTWSPASGNTAQINNLVSGQYVIKVKDAKKCLAYDTIEVPLQVLHAELELADVLCYGDHNGLANIVEIDGAQPVSFVWPDGSMDSIFTQLAAGTYTLDLHDSIGCMVEQSFIIESPDQLLITFQINFDDDGTIEPDGSILALISGGTPPYTVKWSNGANGEEIDSLYNGPYQIMVTDVHGCQHDTIVEVPLSTSVSSYIPNSLLIYPNPAKEKLFITMPDITGVPIDISLFSFDGHLLANQEVTIYGNTGSFDISNVSPGLYVVQCSIRDVIFRQKLVVAR